LGIFVTVGAQMPFDRLTRTLDEWAGRNRQNPQNQQSGKVGCEVFAQIGPTDFEPRHMEFTRFLEPREFQARVEGADVLVAHAGMGSIITALQAGKPILVMPRRGELQETRNDHQIATAERFDKLGRVAVAFDEEALLRRLDHLDQLVAGEPIAPHASETLLFAVRDFIDRSA